MGAPLPAEVQKDTLWKLQNWVPVWQLSQKILMALMCCHGMIVPTRTCGWV